MGVFSAFFGMARRPRVLVFGYGFGADADLTPLTATCFCVVASERSIHAECNCGPAFCVLFITNKQVARKTRVFLCVAYRAIVAQLFAFVHYKNTIGI